MLESTAMNGPHWRRWLWPAAAIAAAALAGLIWSSAMSVDQRQDRVIARAISIALGGFALYMWTFLWAAFFGGLRGRTRLWAVVALLALPLGAAASVRIRGFTGDVVPILEWRWASSAVVEGPRSAGDAGDRRIESPEDYPQFLGPNRDGIVSDPGFPAAWDTPPRLRWRRAVGPAWSGFAIAGDFVVTQEQRGDVETVAGYDRGTGAPLWSHGDPARWDDPLGGPGPRATPTVFGERVYTLGGTGLLNALDLRSGRRLWSRQVTRTPPTYGVSSSPLVDDGRVIVAAGGAATLEAFDAATGEPLWASGDDPVAYGSPIVAELAGVRQLVVLTELHVTGFDAGDGHVLWRYPWPGETEKVAQPVVLPGNRLFVSSGYGVGGKLLRVERTGAGELAVRLLWESRGLKAKITNVVFHDGFLYGLDDGILVCLDPEDGSRRWKRGRYGHGQLILAGSWLVVTRERGGVAVVAADPVEYREVASFDTLEGKSWNHPALAGRELFVRNDREAACWELPAASVGDGS